jgi:carboxymethylenebutenolidase
MLASMIILALLALRLSSTPTCCQAMAALTLDPSFVALHESPLQVDFTPKYGHMEDVAGVQDFVIPAKKGSHGAVLMFHEFWGLNNQIKMTAEKLHAETGFGVIAVDLYGGKIYTDPKEASTAMRDLNEGDATKQIASTIVAVLKNHILGDSVENLGTIGYCMGGGYSLETALIGAGAIKACVMYYGHPEQDQTRLTRLQAPLLGFFGTQDKGITPAMVDQFKADLKTDGKDFHIYSYDAPHAFANPSNPHFNKEATEDSWKKTVSFFKVQLRG